MGVGDHEPAAAQAPARQPAQEVGPECLGLRGAHGHAKHFAPPITVHAHGERDRDGDDIFGHCCVYWNRLIEMPWRIMSIGMRDWGHRF